MGDTGTNITDSKNNKTYVEVTIVGKDKEGIVADTTNYIFRNGGNIEKINQNVVKGLFGMHLEASFPPIDKLKMQKELDDLGRKLDMGKELHWNNPSQHRIHQPYLN